MAVIKCKMCGGDLQLVPGSTVAVCEYCGSKQTVPSADSNKKLTLFARANRLRSACEFDKAAGVYEAIVADFSEEAEAYWGLVLCKYGIEYVDDPATGKKVPTCHRSSFDSVMDDSNFEQALENADAVARKVYREEAKQIEELRKGIIAVSSKEDPYDIFICYKETDENGNRTLDSVLAQDIYDALNEKGYRVFFSRISLEDKLGQEYEPYIFAALNSAKIMLVVGTDYEYFNAVWVKNEWSRFLHLITAGQKKALIPCYKNIDAYDMPKEFARLQAQDLGKVGAVQDLLRGIDKILCKPVVASTNMQNAAQEAVKTIEQEKLRKQVENAVSLGIMALDVGDTIKATQCFEEALKYDSECIGAYLGLIRTVLDREKAAPYIKRIKEINPADVLKYIESHRFVVGDINKRNNLLSVVANPICSSEITLGLLEMGVDGNAKDALMYSVEAFDNSDVTKAFIRNGANVNTFHYWNYYYKEPGEKYGYTEREYHSVLSMAVRSRRSEATIHALINAGADVNFEVHVYNGSYIDNRERKYSYSIINMAVRQSNYDLVNALLKKGVLLSGKRVKRTTYKYISRPDNDIEPSARDDEFSLLSETIWHTKDINMMRILIENHADPNILEARVITRKDAKLQTALHGKVQTCPLIDAVLYSDDLEMIQMLLQNGANPHCKYIFLEVDERADDIAKVEIPVLGLAVQKCRPDAVKLLIDAGASFSEKVSCRSRTWNSWLGRDVWNEDTFPLSELAFNEHVTEEMATKIRKYGWKGSADGMFKKAHRCYYAW